MNDDRSYKLLQVSQAHWFSSLCGGGRDLPEPCGAHGPLCRTYRYDNLGLYHRWAEQIHNVSIGL